MWNTNDVGADTNGTRYRIVNANYPLIYCVVAGTPKTDTGTHVFYHDDLFPCGYKEEK